MTNPILTAGPMTAKGEALVTVEGRAGKLLGAVTGDVVEGRILHAGQKNVIVESVSLVTPSPLRTATPCEALNGTRPCGGCALGLLTYEEQLRQKVALLTDALTEAEVEAPPLETVIGATVEAGFRNKAVLWGGLTDEGDFHFGLFGSGSHTVVKASQACTQTPDWMREVAQTLEGVMVTLSDTLGVSPETFAHSLLLRDGALGDAAPQRLVSIVVTSNDPTRTQTIKDELARVAPTLGVQSVSLSVMPEKTNRATGFENVVLFGEAAIETQLMGLTFGVTADTFLQVNTPQTPPLYDLALSWAEIKKDDTFLDLYCGVGTITLLGAQRAKAALGIEVVEPSTRAAKKNAERNNLENVTFLTGRVEDVLPQHLKTGFVPTVAIMDPAFKGVESTVPETLSQTPLKRLVYVSCNPKTFARDAKAFERLGWRLDRLGAVDLFPGALHLETVGRFVRD